MPPGGASEVLSSLFSVVAISLIASWLVAVVFGPIIGKAMLKAPAPVQGEPKPSKLKNGYQALLRTAIRMRWVTIGITVAMFAAAILALPLVPRQFFPSSDRPELLVDLTLRQNASIAASQATAERVEALLKGDPDVDHYSTYVGRGAIRFYLPLSVHLANPFFSQIVVIAKDIEARDRLQARLEKMLAVGLPEVVARLSPLEMGPPVGWPLQYRVIGPDKDELRRIAEDVAKLMAADTRVRQRQLRLDGAGAPAARAHRPGRGAAPARQHRQHRRGAAGVGHRHDHHAGARRHLPGQRRRARHRQRARLLRHAGLAAGRPRPAGRMVPLSQFARFSEEQEFPLVWRRDRVPTLTVRADVLKGVLPESVVAAIGPSIAVQRQAAAALPDRDRRPVRIEQRLQSANVFSVVPMMILLMLLFMMMLLISFRRLAMVLLIMPLGLIGVVGALLLFSRPLGFVAILGILALIGMIAKNAVILIVSIEEERAAGHSVRDAVITAASNRLTPLVLTAISTVLGLIPIAPTIFWGPMAIAIMGGLMVASLLTLILLPVLYITMFGRDDKKTPPPALPAAAAGLSHRWQAVQTPGGSGGAVACAAAVRCSSCTWANCASCSTRWTRRRFASATSTRRPATTSSTGPPKRRPSQALSMVVHLGTPRPTRRWWATRCASTSGAAPSAKRRELSKLFRVGRISLVIGLAFLAVAIAAGEALAGAAQQGELCLAGQGKPGHRRLGGAVAAAGDLPLRLVAAARAGEAVRPAGPHAGDRGMSTCAAVVQGACRHGARAVVLCAVAGHRPERQAGQPALRRRWPRPAPPGPACGCCRPTPAVCASARCCCCCRASCGIRWWPASMSRAAPSARACRCTPASSTIPCGLPRGSARNAFELISSLLPGSVPTDETEAAIEYHCLDVQPAGGRATGGRRARPCRGAGAGAAPWMSSCCRRRPSCC